MGSEQLTHGAKNLLQFVKGVGPRRADVLASEGIRTATDLLYYVPPSYIDRSSIATLQSLRHRLHAQTQGTLHSREEISALRSEVTLVGAFHSVVEKSFGRGRKMLVATLSDDTSTTADVVFWNYTDYYKKILKNNELYAVSGKAELNRFGRITFSHPEIELIEMEDQELYRQGRILPKYRISQAMKNVGLGIRQMRLLVEQVLETELNSIHETLSTEILERHQFISRASAMRSLHFPESKEKLHQAQQRMKFEEMFFFELLLALRLRGTRVRDSSPKILPPSPRARQLLDSLPFQLTNAQKRVVHEIVADMGSSNAMSRLLQGDVGSGKTIVALLSMLMAADGGYQSILLAPTEILAEQHFQTLKRYCEPLDIEIAQLVGGQKKKQREEVMQRIVSGKASIVVGTHALFGGSSKRLVKEVPLQYNKVGLIVIDEQHRFGVEQRAKLRDLGLQSYKDTSPKAPHILVMSATPIPRTLSMTAYGDLDVSLIDELPPHRQTIKTKVVFESALADQYEFIKSELHKGRQAYIVYPLVEESEKLDLKAASIAFDELQRNVFPEFKCGLLHGQLAWNEKEDAMRCFLQKDFDVLVATTVVEVGIDIPNATVMLIQNAERFGLAQLHQLRGRVGRGDSQSYCLLATKDHFAFHLRKKEVDQQEKMSAIIRLRTMEQTNDGFQIAEVDLKLRGPGDVLGTRQSGLPNFRFTDLVGDADIVAKARGVAFALVEKDPHLRDTKHVMIRDEYMHIYSGATSFFDTA